MNNNLKVNFDVTKTLTTLDQLVQDLEISTKVSQCGYVHSISDGIATVKGIASVELDEVVEFEGGIVGIVRELKQYEVKVVLFDGAYQVSQGSKVFRKNVDLRIPVSSSIIGRVLNIFGEPLDSLGAIVSDDTEYLSVERAAPRLSERHPVSKPLTTGTIAIDSMIPIGLGQRELILGDMQTGKTSIALNAIISQKYRTSKPVYCFYVAIGQKMDSVLSVYNTLKDVGAMEYTTIIAASASNSAHTQFIAPYAGCTMAEFFMYKGHDTLIVYDDLSKHAVAHREISRLLGRPAGRDAFPADSFYIHARLLERAASLSKNLGGGTMTALPIVETQEGDISSYIATNVISITDGQVFLDRKEFDNQQRPAIDVGLSVSRIGSTAQAEVTKTVSRSMKAELAQYTDLARFLQFTGSDLDKTQERILKKGKQTKFLILQDVDEIYSLQEQVILCIGAHNGIFSNLTADQKQIRAIKKLFLEIVYRDCPKIIETLNFSNELSERDMATLKRLAEKFSEVSERS